MQISRRAFLAGGAVAGGVVAKPRLAARLLSAGERAVRTHAAAAGAPSGAPPGLSDGQALAGRADGEALAGLMREPPLPTAPRSFVSRPDLSPPTVLVEGEARWLHPGGSAFLLAVQGDGPGQTGLVILDPGGDVVWFSPQPEATSLAAFRLQQYGGQPVLTWAASGAAASAGPGGGTAGGAGASFTAVDTSYAVVLGLTAPAGRTGVARDFLLTPSGTAIVLWEEEVAADLSAVGGSKRGTLLENGLSEFDPVSGEVLFEWSAHGSGDVPAGQSYAVYDASQPFDAYGLDSVDVFPDGSGDYLVSGANTAALYRISRSTGHVAWRLGGKRSDFSVGAGGRFSAQHDARVHADGAVVSLFADTVSPGGAEQSRALVLDLAEAPLQALVVGEGFHHTDPAFCTSGGSVQLGDGGWAVVGWGDAGAFSLQQAPPPGSGTPAVILLDGRMPTGIWSDAVRLGDWSASPPGSELALAVLAAPSDARSWQVFASWNGATAVRYYEVLAATPGEPFVEAGLFPRTGFETVMTVHGPGSGTSFQVAALASGGTLLGSSPVVTV